MLKRLLLLVPILLILSACAPATQPALMPFVVTLTTPPPNFPTAAQTPAAALAANTAAASPPPPTFTDTSVPAFTATYTPPVDTPVPATYTPAADTATPTSGPIETYIPYVATPTETQLPPLALPTEQSRPPVLLAWTGMPTYLADSDPDTLFRVDYDPDSWAQTAGNFGGIVLASRQIPYCTITPWSGRGLPVDWKVVHEFRNIGSAAFDVSTVSSQGVIKFVSYVGGDHHVLTGFQVTFDAQPDACLQAAETLFGTLRSFIAIPTATPALSPTP